jgi:hypothetical protein
MAARSVSQAALDRSLTAARPLIRPLVLAHDRLVLSGLARRARRAGRCGGPRTAVLRRPRPPRPLRPGTAARGRSASRFGAMVARPRARPPRTPGLARGVRPPGWLSIVTGRAWSTPPLSSFHARPVGSVWSRHARQSRPLRPRAAHKAACVSSRTRCPALPRAWVAFAPSRRRLALALLDSPFPRPLARTHALLHPHPLAPTPLAPLPVVHLPLY